MWNNFNLKWSAEENNCCDLVKTDVISVFIQIHTQPSMAHDSHKWVMINLILQLLNTRNQCAPSYSPKDISKITRSSEPEERLSSNGYDKFQYPKEETTYGVGYGHHLHPFYYQGNSLLYSCAISGDWHPIIEHLYHMNAINNLGKSNSVGQTEDHYIIQHTDYSKKSDKTIPTTPQNYLRYFQPNFPITLKRSDIFNESDADTSFNKKHTTKTNHQEHNNMSAQHNKPKVQSNMDNTIYSKFIIRGKHDEPMIPIIHSYLATHDIQPKVVNTTDNSVNNKYIIRSKSVEPMIPIIHVATQVMPYSDVTNSDVSQQTIRKDFLKYINPPPRPTTPMSETSNGMQSKTQHRRNQQNLVDFLTMLHIIPHADDIDFF